ncbi:hypothetical protein ABE488_01725 [Luteimonas sp. TWI662]|uniref:hypothetical protein n=1 Tax=Luteimonas sp. TWI662 TaxID=3136789 RepID=UPI0032082027
MTFAEGTEQERMEQLRCRATALEHVIILRTREAYAKMIANKRAPDVALPPVQGGLI